ncbi:hypothetical protein LZF95_10615 [Algoriphagus sp. AGSA1]|uniref:hypothetical protein n=1 Tax=Algoriphagus sp. AGSA1 TaxID=2907213 RepID=UPI001F1EEB18|nr:hypothetical protein [Algoriphagus sp. AGSA1]MCE7055128.1 hypothetical protein [Algoriphagus sp. AGSA1]
MRISSLKGNFKVIQTIKNRDELLVLGSWSDLIRVFDSSRAFLVNNQESLFGIFLCKQECVDFLAKIIQEIDYHEWEDFTLASPVFRNHLQM